MNTISTTYLGDLRTTNVHLQSGTELITDAPVDNQGRGESFSPTDLLCTALVSCMITIMGIAAKTHGFSIDNLKAEVQKMMGSNPRKVAACHIKFYFPPNSYDNHQKMILEKAALNCPVALSLSADLNQQVEFIWS